jgi:hypothetical protein
MFDKTKKLSREQIGRIMEFTKIPRFTSERLEICAKENILTFKVDAHTSGIHREWMMIESGMQQQAAALVCSALGVGMVFSNLGEDGKVLSDDQYATIIMKLSPMKASYNGSFWSSLSPSSWETNLPKNLPDPVRDGNKPFLATLAHLTIYDRGSQKLTDQSVSQLLWAARGRTPHFYLSRPWGMTIPTWAGGQNISTIYLVSKNTLAKYVNWRQNKPAHELSELRKLDGDLFQNLLETFSAHQAFIVLERNEIFARALWEIGYQLLNLLLQAKALDIFYRAIFLGERQKDQFKMLGINDPVAIIAL